MSTRKEPRIYGEDIDTMLRLKAEEWPEELIAKLAALPWSPRPPSSLPVPRNPRKEE